MCWVPVCSYLTAGVVGVFGQLAVESLQEELVCDFADVHTGLVQHGEDALMLLLHQIHDDLVVKVVDLKTQEQKMSRGNDSVD